MLGQVGGMHVMSMNMCRQLVCAFIHMFICVKQDKCSILSPLNIIFVSVWHSAGLSSLFGLYSAVMSVYISGSCAFSLFWKRTQGRYVSSV